MTVTGELGTPATAFNIGTGPADHALAKAIVVVILEVHEGVRALAESWRTVTSRYRLLWAIELTGRVACGFVVAVRPAYPLPARSPWFWLAAAAVGIRW
jgi:hypothetical protein